MAATMPKAMKAKAAAMKKAPAAKKAEKAKKAGTLMITITACRCQIRGLHAGNLTRRCVGKTRTGGRYLLALVAVSLPLLLHIALRRITRAVRMIVRSSHQGMVRGHITYVYMCIYTYIYIYIHTFSIPDLLG